MKLEDRASTIRDTLGTLTADQVKEANASNSDTLARLERILDHALVVTAMSDHPLVTEQMIAGVVNSLDQVASGLQAYAQGQGAAHLGTVDSALESLAATIALWPGDRKPLTQNISNAASTYRRSAGRQFSTLKSEVEQARKSATSIQSKQKELETSFQQAGAGIASED